MQPSPARWPGTNTKKGLIAMTIRLPPDLLAEVRQIANKTGRRPGEIVVDLVREALQARRGLPRGKQASATQKPVQHKPEPLPPFVFRKSKHAA